MDGVHVVLVVGWVVADCCVAVRLISTSTATCMFRQDCTVLQRLRRILTLVKVVVIS